MFRRNVGGADRVVRVFLGAVLLAAGVAMLVKRIDYGPAVAIVGFLVLASGVLGSCGLYIPFGISTYCSRSSASAATRSGVTRVIQR